MPTSPTAGSPAETELKFFEGLKAHLETAGSPLSLPNPKPHSGQDLKPDCIPGHRVFVTVRFAAHLKRLAVDLTFYDAHDEFESLKDKHKSKVEDDLREVGEVQWNAPAHPEWHVTVERHVDDTDEDNWPSYYDWLRNGSEILFDWGQKEVAEVGSGKNVTASLGPAAKTRRVSGVAQSAAMGRIKITWERSGINQKIDQKRTIRALGLKKLGQTVEHDDNRTIRGMVLKVRHLVAVQEDA